WDAQFGRGAAPLVSATPGGGLVAIAAASPDSQGGIDLQLRQASGLTLWEARVPGRLPRLRLVGNGSAVLLAYEQAASGRTVTRYERRLAYLPVADRGIPRWATGGAYTGDSLFAAVAPDGSSLVSLDVDRRGGK